MQVFQEEIFLMATGAQRPNKDRFDFRTIKDYSKYNLQSSLASYNVRNLHLTLTCISALAGLETPLTAVHSQVPLLFLKQDSNDEIICSVQGPTTVTAVHPYVEVSLFFFLKQYSRRSYFFLQQYKIAQNSVHAAGHKLLLFVDRLHSLLIFS